jgi:23S rRNA pseudouridine1911/1915/1917 synthase
VEAKASKILKDGDIVEVEMPAPEQTEIPPQDIPIQIVYQDNALAVINKQQGLTVHPANGVYTDTLVNALLFHLKDLSGINGIIRPGIVHRLDKGTSGLMVVAKTDAAHVSLAKQIGEKTAKRVYFALVEGVVKVDEGVIEQPVGRNKSDRKKMAVVLDGKYAKTHYYVERRLQNYTLVRFELDTGRTHQIRVHAQFIGHPVVGDETYGFKHQKFNLNGQLLHSKRLSFFHPLTGKWMEFDSDLPDYFKHILDVLK